MDAKLDTSKENTHHSVWDEKHFATRVYFYFKDCENEKAAETACYEHKSTIPNAGTEVYRDRGNKGYYFFLSRV
jgi:hypothetical protein